MRCPIQCGQCCDELWSDVVIAPETTIICPHLGARGCELPRDERPVGCTEYLCPVARAVIAGRLTLRKARRIVRGGLPWAYECNGTGRDSIDVRLVREEEILAHLYNDAGHDSVDGHALINAENTRAIFFTLERGEWVVRTLYLGRRKGG